MQVQWHKNTSKHQSCNLLLLWCRRLSQTLGAVSSCLLRESFCSIWLKTSKILTTWRVGELLALVSCFSSLFSRNLTWLGPSSLSASWLRFQKELSGQFISSRATLLEQGMWFPQPFLWTWEVPGMEDVREEAGEEIHPHPPTPPPTLCSRKRSWSISKIYLCLTPTPFKENAILTVPFASGASTL